MYRTSILNPLILELYGIIKNGKFNNYRNHIINVRRRNNLYGTLINASLVVTNNNTLKHLTDFR